MFTIWHQNEILKLFVSSSCILWDVYKRNQFVAIFHGGKGRLWWETVDLLIWVAGSLAQLDRFDEYLEPSEFAKASCWGQGNLPERMVGWEQHCLLTLGAQQFSTSWWRQIFFYFHPCFGKIPILTHILPLGSNHQLVNDCKSDSILVQCGSSCFRFNFWVEKQPTQ